MGLLNAVQHGASVIPDGHKPNVQNGALASVLKTLPQFFRCLGYLHRNNAAIRKDESPKPLKCRGYYT